LALSQWRKGVPGTFQAQRSAFVGLRYANLPGGEKTCLNSELAACELRVERAGREPLSPHTAHRTAVELLMDDR